MTTKIPWVIHPDGTPGETWNPITGCTPIAAGCENCWAKRTAKRFAGRFGYPKDKPFAVTFHKNRLDQPSKWKKPRSIFVCSMGDFFHKDVKPDWREKVWKEVCENDRHHFFFLTKRYAKAEDFFYAHATDNSVPDHVHIGFSVSKHRDAAEFYVNR